MNFISYVFAIFLIIVFATYWCLPRSRQNVLLWAASYVFYGWWDWRFLSLIFLSTVVDYSCGLALGRISAPRSRKIVLSLSLITNLGLLGAFKYYGFFVESLSSVFEACGWSPSFTVLQIVLPVGISFYTFQTISYTVDVYRQKLKPTRSFTDFAVYVSFFPQLVAGPIERGTNLLPQVTGSRAFSAERFHDGLMLIATGFLRKAVIADNMAMIVNAIFAEDVSTLTAPQLLLGTYAFAWQIYGDFSGYSDIARGTAKLLGFELMVNFRQPYFASGPSDFWRRWHISLSTWLRDYLYIPLGGNRHGPSRTYRNLLAVMLLGGLWHGAAWTYVFWGGIHGLWLAVDRLLGHGPSKAVADAPRLLTRVAKITGTFHLVCLGWLFFRVDSVSNGVTMLGSLTRWNFTPETLSGIFMMLMFAVPLLLVDLRCERRNEEYPFQHGGWRSRATVCAAAVAALLIFGRGDANAFIYFQF